MKIFGRFILVPAVIAPLFAGLGHSPSDPVGIYSVVERVALTPNAEHPTAIQVWGSFMVSDQEMGDNYASPVRGYLYLSMPAADERALRAEWADLERSAGTKAVIGFFNKYTKTGFPRIRCAKEPPANPDAYSSNGSGVVKVPNRYNTQAATILKDLQADKITDAKCA